MRLGALLLAILLAAAPDARAADGGISPPQNHDPGWTESFDFDGDGRNDSIDVSFSRGAHCCYKVAVTLSSTGRKTWFPFELDGGYVTGLDLGRPEHFRVERGGRIFMEIATYGRDRLPIPREWRRVYGISTHHIVIEYRGKKWIVRDDPNAGR